MKILIDSSRFLILGFLLASALSFFGYVWVSWFVVNESIDLINAAWLFALIFFAYLKAVVFLRAFLKQPGPAYQTKNIKLVIFFLAMLFHLSGCLAGPFFEDDYYRYLWDAYVFSEFGSPYGLAPSDFFSDPGLPEKFQVLLNGVNHPDIATIYAPTLQYSFLLGFALAPGEVWTLQFLYSLANLWIIGLLARRVDPVRLLLYAWNPLVIKEVAYTAHPDVLGALLLCLAIFGLANYQRLAALCCGLAMAAKPFAWPLVPFILLGIRRRYWIWCLGGLLLLYGPFIGISAWLTELPEASAESQVLLNFGQDWLFNPGPVFFLSAWLAPSQLKLIGLGLFIAFWLGLLAYAWRRGFLAEDVPRLVVLSLGGLLLLSPVVNPWYLLWLLPFAALCKFYTPWVASLALLLSYASGINLNDLTLGAYQTLAWVRPLEYGLISTAILFDIYKAARRRFYPYPHPGQAG